MVFRNSIQHQTNPLIPRILTNKRFRSTLTSCVNTSGNSFLRAVSFLTMFPPDKNCLKTPYMSRRLSVSSTRRRSSINLGWETGVSMVHISRGGCGIGTNS